MNDFQNKKEIVKGTIITCMPAFRDILSDRDWDRVIQHYLRRVDNIPKEYNGLIKSSCLMDLIICSLGEEKIAKANKETINAINNEICKALTYCNYYPQFMGKVKDLVRKTIMEMDNDFRVQNSAYKNWINELFVFNLLAEWGDYDIVDLERSLGNGKTCDFVCRNRNGLEIWFEVITFQRIDPSKQDNSISINEFINERVKIKYQEKTKGIMPDNIPNLRIFPVIEYVDGLERFEIALNSEIATEPFAVMKNNINGVVRVELLPLNMYISKIRTQQEMI